MFSKVWLINLILLCGVCLLGFQASRAWKEDQKRTEVAAARPSGQDGPGSDRFLLPKRMPAESSFDGVVGKNLFSPTRKEVVQETVEAEPPKEVQKTSPKELALHGVVMVGDYKAALIRNLGPDQKSTPGNKGNENWRKIGETVGSYKVAEIHRDRVVLEGAANKIELFLYDEGKPKKPVFIPKKSTPVDTAIASGERSEKPSPVQVKKGLSRSTKTRTTLKRDATRGSKTRQLTRSVSRRKQADAQQDRDYDAPDKRKPGFSRPD